MKNILLKATALSLFGAGILAFSGTSYAGCYYGPHRVNARIYRQEGRIYRGVRSGELTRWEARDLRHDKNRFTVKRDTIALSMAGISPSPTVEIYNMT